MFTPLSREQDLNPIQRMLTAYLAPKQKRLGETLQSFRSLRGLFEWRDPLATWWLALLLAAAALVLALPPWQRIMQLLGAALFGPHMYFVGRMRAVMLAMGFDAETCSEALGTVGRDGEMWRDVARCGEIWRGRVRCFTHRDGERWRDVARHGETWRDMAR